MLDHFYKTYFKTLLKTTGWEYVIFADAIDPPFDIINLLIVKFHSLDL